MMICKRAMFSAAFLICLGSYCLAQTAVSPYTLTVARKPMLLRSYLMFDGKKRTHVISVGSPGKVSYSYDLKQGALLQVWRGGFLDVTEMWKDRGEPQLAKPLGTVLPFSAAPAIARLADKESSWPDSIAFDALHNDGYILDKSRMPTFIYSSNGVDIKDKIMVQNNGESVVRTIEVTNNKELLYCRIAAARTIKALKDNAYNINAGTYSVKIAGNTKAFIRQTENGQELLAPLEKGTASLTYSIIW